MECWNARNIVLDCSENLRRLLERDLNARTLFKYPHSPFREALAQFWVLREMKNGCQIQIQVFRNIAEMANAGDIWLW
jgi:hypothetical protein